MRKRLQSMNFTSTQFHLHYIAQYKLIIKANYSQDILYVLSNDGQVLVYMNYDNRNPTDAALKLLSLPFQQVFISIPYQNLTFIPDELYDSEDKDKYQEFMDNPTLPSKSTSLDFLAIQALFQYDVLLEQQWRSLFPDAQFIPEFKLNLYLARPHVPLQGEVLGVFSGDHCTDVFLFINGKFKFYNSFEVLTEEDLNYFILNLLETFHVHAKVSKVLYANSQEKIDVKSQLASFGNELIQIQSNQVMAEIAELPKEITESYLIDLPTCVL